MKNQKGYTLVEILVTVVIIGVMAGLALPGYFSTVEEARSNEAKINLQIIRTGQKVRALNDPKKDYWNPGANFTLTTLNSTLNVDITTQYYGITDITANNSANPKTFTAQATRNSTKGGDTGRFYTIDQNGTIRDKNGNVVL